MKKLIKTIAYIAMSAVTISCAKNVPEGPNEANLRYFNAWMKLNHPDLKPTGLGIYIFPEDEVEGTGIEVKEDGFVYVNYVSTDLEGNIDSYTTKEAAIQLGTYDETVYYGPKVSSTIKGTIPAGVSEALKGMKVGSHRKVIIPSWLMTYNIYDSEEQYIKNAPAANHTIYDISITDFTDSINKHEIYLIEKFVQENPLKYNFDSRMTNDTTGFYYQPVKEGNSAEKFTTDSEIYINYTGRLLSGQVFDTTIEKVAKDNGLYSSSNTYGPVEIHWGEKYNQITMGTDNSSIIDGFAYTLWHMHPMESGIGIFYSPLGYSYNGSGKSIPGYAPLIFEIEIVEKPKE